MPNYSEKMDSSLDRTVYIAPITPQIVTEIENYFNGFGWNESFRVRTDNTFQYGLVQFGEIEEAKKVLERSPHWIAKNFVMATAYREQFAPGYNPRAPDFESESNILNILNDHCLKIVFKHLSKFDLANAADVCVRFNQHAKGAFAANHKDKSVEIGNEDDTASVQAMFRNFGSLIEKLVIRNCIFSNTDEPNIAAAFPCLRNLKVLNIIRTHWERSILENQRFPKLEELSLEYNSGSRIQDCNSGLRVQKRNSEFRFRKVQKVQKGENMALCNFLKTNQTLKKIVIIKNEIGYSVDVFRSICQHQDNLVELQIEQPLRAVALRFQEEKNNLIKLTSLKSLTIEIDKFNLDYVFNHLVVESIPIEVLTLKDGEFDNRNLIRNMSRFKQIKVLDLQNVGLYEFEMIEWIRGWPLLQQLSLESIEFYDEDDDDNFNISDLSVETLKKIVAHAHELSKLVLNPIKNLVIGVEDYKSMLDSIKNRPEKARLDIDGERVVLNVPHEILQENQDYIHIHIRRYSLSDIW